MHIRKQKAQGTKKLSLPQSHTVYCLICPSGSHLCIYTKKYPFMVSAFIREMEGGYHEGRRDAEFMQVRCRHDS